jgi:hypothetical protein
VGGGYDTPSMIIGATAISSVPNSYSSIGLSFSLFFSISTRLLSRPMFSESFPLKVAKSSPLLAIARSKPRECGERLQYISFNKGYLMIALFD